MNNGLKLMDNDLHAIKMGEVSERWYLGPGREGWPQYLGMSPTNFRIGMCGTV